MVFAASSHRRGGNWPQNGLCYNEFNESSFSPALPALIPVPTVHFQPVFWQGHCSVTAGWSCTWTLCAAPASSPHHIPGAASHRCPGTLRDGAGQCCWGSSCRSASGAPTQEHVAQLLPRAPLGAQAELLQPGELGLCQQRLLCQTLPIACAVLQGGGAP